MLPARCTYDDKAAAAAQASVPRCRMLSALLRAPRANGFLTLFVGDRGLGISRKKKGREGPFVAKGEFCVKLNYWGIEGHD